MKKPGLTWWQRFKNATKSYRKRVKVCGVTVWKSKIQETDSYTGVQTMNDKYGDGSNHEVCKRCGMCVDCGDCEKYGCEANR